jgi:drug/metabolite transporter (DMT)-like permease
LWVNNGSSFLAIKVAINTIPPMLSAGIRFSVSGAILFAVYDFLGDSKYDFSKDSQHRILKRIHRPREVISKQQWKSAVTLGVTLFLGGQGLLAWGEQYLSSGIAGLLNSTIPL